MTLLETERLVRKISELLPSGGASDLAVKIAGDFAAACHAANLRLQQCEAMIKAGDRPQAIQLAETAPNLLDLITVLEFRQADEWRTFCQQNAFAVAERIDARAVQELNACYAQGIATDHPLYAAYRKAVLNRNDEAALVALQSITRLNANDANAASELARLDAKVLALKLENLGRLVSGGDAASVVAGIEAIEDFGFKAKPDGEIWRQAEAIRCVTLLQEAGKLKAAGQWAEVLGKLDFVGRLRKEYQIELSGTDARLLNELESWAAAEHGKDRTEKEFGSLLAELRYRIQQSEEKDTCARYVELPELKQDSEGLHKVWRALTDFTRPLPEDVTVAFRKRTGLIDAEIARRTAARTRIILTAAAAIVLIAGLIVWFALQRLRAADFQRQLQTAVAGHQARAAMQLIELLHGNEKGLLRVSGVDTALASAETFVAEQKALLMNFEAAFAKLPNKLSGDPEAAQINAIADQLTRTRTALDALAPDLKQENEPRVKAFEQQWQQYLAAGGTAVNGTLEQWVTGAERLCDQLDYRAPMETVSAQLRQLRDELQKITDCAGGFKNHMSLRNELLQRAQAVGAKYAAYEKELKKIDDGLAGLKKAMSYQEYSSALALIASSEYSSAPVVAEATAMRSLATDEESMLRSLLGATNPATWAYINKRRRADFIPEMAMPSERAAIQSLFADPAMNARHEHYRLWLNADKTTSVDWITAGPLDTSEGWKTIPAWTVSPTATTANFESRDYGNFSGQMKLSTTQPVYRIENIPEPDATAAFNAVGLDKLNGAAAGYGAPLLPVLDALKESREGSPIFRAELFCRLAGIMEFQPDAWGLSFSPSIRRAVKRIEAITGRPLEGGDWLVTSNANLWGPKLEEFFMVEKPVSYSREAATRLALSQAVAKDGLRYVGYADADGKPVLAVDPAPAELWCIDSASGKPALCQGAPLPLSPLFMLPATRSTYLNKAGIKTNAPGSAEALPPMFQGVNKMPN
ncbi:MAG TPA: hypothetical protein VF988_07740 [Verrucomicrobiae bacterium]